MQPEDNVEALRPHEGLKPNLGLYLRAGDIEDKDLSRTWLVDGVLEADRVYQVFGEWKSGKSLVVMDMCGHLAMGRDWAGRQTVQSLVIWVAGESVDDVQARLQAFVLHNDVAGKDMLFYLRTQPVHLTNAEQAFLLAAEIKELREICPDCPVVLVIDTLNRNFGPGMSENSDEGMGAFVTHLLDVVAKPNKAAVLVVHHSGHMDKGRGRGHSSFPAAIDGTLKVTKTGDGPEYVCLESKEARSSAAEAEACFRIDVQELPWKDNFGRPIEAPVLVPADASNMPGEPKAERLGADQRIALEVLREMHQIAVANLTDGGFNGTDAKVEIRAWKSECQGRGVKQAGNTGNWTRLRQRLKERGMIREENPFVWLQ